MTLKTRKPSGRPSWPLILMAGEAKTGKTWAAAEFSGDPRIGRTFWMDLGEGCADEYGAVPGADYDIVDHDGTWVDIIAQAAAVRDAARAELDAGGKPCLFVIDSMTAEWAMLTEWTNNRAKRSKNNRKLLAENPDAEIDVSSNYWNDANSRHNRLMNILKTFPGIVVMTTLESEKTQIGPGGRPIEGAPKVAKPDAQKRLPADATVWVRLSLDSPPTIVGLRSVKATVRPGLDRPKPWPDFSLSALVFDRLGIQAGGADARAMPALDADQELPEEKPTPAEIDPHLARAKAHVWETAQKLGWGVPELSADYRKAHDADLNSATAVDLGGYAAELLRELEEREQATTEKENAEQTPMQRAAKFVGALLDTATVARAEQGAAAVTRDEALKDLDVSKVLTPHERETLDIRDGDKVTLEELSGLVVNYVADHKHPVHHQEEKAA